MLTDLKLKNLKAKEKPYKVADRDGLYLLVTAAGARLFRYDYRINGRRETLALGRYDDTGAKELPRELGELGYGVGMSLAEARLLLTRVRRSVEQGDSPARAKAVAKNKVRAEFTLDGWASKYFEDADLADSTRAMRKAIYDRDVKKAFGRLRLEEIAPSQLMACWRAMKTTQK